MTLVARFVTDLADQAVLIPVAIAVAVVFAIAGWWRGVVAWTTAVGATLGVMLLLKLAFLACGPLLPSMDVSPSGHTAAAGVVYGGLLAIMARYITGQERECQKPGALRRELDCRVAEPPVQHRGPDLKHTMGATG